VVDFVTKNKFFKLCEKQIAALPTVLWVKRYSKPITILDRSREFQEVGAPRFQDSRHMKVVRLSAPTHWLPLPLRKYSWYSFLLKAESTPGPKCNQKDYVNEKFQ